MLLLNTRSVSISMSTAIKRKDKETTEKLENQIAELELNPVLKFDEILKVKNELKEFREQKKNT